MSPNVEVMEGGVLRINSIQKSEAGEYRCEATNLAGTAQVIATLMVQEPPSLTMQPSGSVILQAGEELRLICSARGDPLPSLSWSMMGQTTQLL